MSHRCEAFCMMQLSDLTHKAIVDKIEAFRWRQQIRKFEIIEEVSKANTTTLTVYIMPRASVQALFKSVPLTQ